MFKKKTKKKETKNHDKQLHMRFCRPWTLKETNKRKVYEVKRNFK